MGGAGGSGDAGAGAGAGGADGAGGSGDAGAGAGAGGAGGSGDTGAGGRGDDSGAGGAGGSGDTGAGGSGDTGAGGSRDTGSGGEAGSNDPGGGDGKGGAGGAEPIRPANDRCPGEALDLSLGKSMRLFGTMTGALDDLTTFCVDWDPGPGNPEVVYQLDLPEDATVSAHVNAMGFDPVLSLRHKTCREETDGDSCLDFGGSMSGTRMPMSAGRYWLVVESADSNGGDFELAIDATSPRCGDGVTNVGEECDPGHGVTDDGCFDPGTATQCLLGEPPMDPTVAGCPGFGPVGVSLSADALSPTITRLGPHHNGSGGRSHMNDLTSQPVECGWTAEGPENVFHVVPQATGTLHARVGHDGAGRVMCVQDPSCGDLVLYARQGTCEAADPPVAGQQMACMDIGHEEILEIELPVTQGSEYWVFVDGLDEMYGVGVYYLELWLL